MGRMQRVDIVVHVDDMLDEEQRRELIGSLERMGGVQCATFTEGRPHLMRVEYDPETMNSQDLIGTFSQHRLHAELIGPI